MGDRRLELHLSKSAYAMDDTTMDGSTESYGDDFGDDNDTTNETIAVHSTQIGAGMALAVVTLATAFGNILVIAAVMSWRRLRVKQTSWFIVSLAVSDVSVACLVMSWNAVSYTLGYWPFGFFCRVHVALDIMISTASILNLCVIAVDRYWAITKPFEYQEKMTKRRALIMIAVAWILSFVLSFLPVFSNIHTVPNSMNSLELDPPQCIFLLNRYYAVISSCISFYIPSAIMIAIYARIFREARRQEKLIRNHNTPMDSNQRGEHKAAKTLGTILGVFICCWLPFFVVNCILPFCRTCVSDSVFQTVLWLGWINSSLNPLIYATNREFRNAFKRLLCRQRFLRERTLQYSTTTTLLTHLGNGKIDSNENERRKNNHLETNLKREEACRAAPPAPPPGGGSGSASPSNPGTPRVLRVVSDAAVEDNTGTERDPLRQQDYPERNVGHRLAQYKRLGSEHAKT
ncbi:D(1) dopamine receptor-like [Lytechinus pictus]|uniref:D(1) dopamine receptor-like n=1 Tax=Lytechinus pictus TaxID=7653 RepID=UPI0030B9EF59